MAHRSIGQERFGFAGRTGATSRLDELGKLLDWTSVSALLGLFGQQGRARLAAAGDVQGPALSIWYDLSDVKLAEALDDRASFRRF